MEVPGTTSWNWSVSVKKVLFALSLRYYDQNAMLAAAIKQKLHCSGSFMHFPLT